MGKRRHSDQFESKQETEERVARILAHKFFSKHSDWSEWEDWKQEASIAVWNASVEFDPKRFRSYGAYLYVFAHHRLVDWLRRNGPHTRTDVRRLRYLGVSDWDEFFRQNPATHERGASYQKPRIDYEFYFGFCNSDQQKKIVFLALNGYRGAEIARICEIGEAVVQRCFDQIRRRHELAA